MAYIVMAYIVMAYTVIARDNEQTSTEDRSKLHTNVVVAHVAMANDR